MSRIRTNFITNRFANGAPTVSNGLIIAGVTTFTGPIAGIAGTVSGFTKFDNISVSGVTTSIGTFHIRPSNGQLTPKISYNDSIAEALIFGDNVQARFGGSSDLRIYHDSNHSYIDDTGTGNLKLRSNNFRVSNADESKISATFQPAAGVELYYDNTSRMSTASYGIAVNGNILFQEELVHIGDTDTKIKFPSAGNTISFETAGSEKVRITSSGYVGINTTTPGRLLNVQNSSTGSYSTTDFNGASNTLLRIHNPSGTDNSGVGYHTGLEFVTGSGANSYGQVGLVRTGNNIGDIFFKFRTGASSYAERLRITSTGHIVTGGLDSPSFNNNSANVKVFEITGEGTDAKYGVINISGNENSSASIGAIKFINRDNSNASSGANPNSRMVAAIDVQADTSDSNAGNDSGGILRLLTKPESGNLTERMRISSQGYVSGNINVPCWFGRQDTAHNITNGTWTTVINLGNDVTNPSLNNGAWSESNGIFTVGAGQAGTYYVFGACGIDDIQSDDIVRVGISKNNASPAFFGEQRAHAGESNQIYQASIMMVITVAETDTIRLKVYHNEGSTEPTEPNRTYFGGYRLST